MTDTSREIYAKLADARVEFHSLELTKTGHNKFAGYRYFELADFLIPAMECLRKQGLVPVVSFDAEYAHLTLYETDGDGVIHIQSPMAEANLKGCHPIQNMGAVETYSRRYLWTSLMEVVEHDAIDGAEPVQEEVIPPRATTRAADSTPKPTDDTSAEAEPEAEPPDETSITTEEGAVEIADMLIELATGMHGDSVRSLADFWTKNKAVIDTLDNDWPKQYARVKSAFTAARKAVETKQ